MQVGIAALNFVCGFILVIGSYVMEGLPETRDAQRVLVHFFRFIPPFNLGRTPALQFMSLDPCCCAGWAAVWCYGRELVMCMNQGSWARHDVQGRGSSS